MDPEALSHVFEPFFTTRELGHGTGLGLSSVEGAIAQSGGFVTAESEVGTGSSFTIFLPRTASEAVTSPTNLPSRTARGGPETILLVEDEPGVLAVTARALRTLGYTVVEAGDPAIALAIAARGAAPFDLLVTDVVMPGMNGRELAERLTALRPGLPTVYMSGYSPEHVFGDGLLEAGAILLTKPFARDELASRVRALLDQRPAEAG